MTSNTPFVSTLRLDLVGPRRPDAKYEAARVRLVRRLSRERKR